MLRTSDRARKNRKSHQLPVAAVLRCRHRDVSAFRDASGPHTEHCMARAADEQIEAASAKAARALAGLSVRVGASGRSSHVSDQGVTLYFSIISGTRQSRYQTGQRMRPKCLNAIRTMSSEANPSWDLTRNEALALDYDRSYHSLIAQPVGSGRALPDSGS